MDTLKKLARLTEALCTKEDADKAAAFKKIVNFLVNGTSWSTLSKDLSTIDKSDLTAEKFALSDDEFADLKKKSNKTKDTPLAILAFQKSICKKLGLVLLELEKDSTDDRFEDVILPLLVLAADLPFQYLSERDPFGARINFSANDSFKSDKSFLFAPRSYESLSLNPSSSGLITRPFIIPILQFVIRSDRYITAKRLKDIPFLVQCLRFAVHFEDPGMERLRSCLWELAVRVIKAVEFQRTRESVAIFDQLNALTWVDNGEECTKAVWRTCGSSPSKNVMMTREEVYAHIAMLRTLNRRVPVNVHLKSCFRDVMRNLMRSITHRKSSEDCMALLKLLNSWMSKGKDGPLDVQFVRMMIRDVMESYDSFLAKSPSESIGATTTYLLILGQETLAVNNNLKSIKSSLESLFDRVNNAISKSGQGASDSLSEYVKFLTNFLNECDDASIDMKPTPWFSLFRAVFVRCFVVKMKMDWVEETPLLIPLYKKMSNLLKTVTHGLEESNSCDYMNECIPTLTEAVYLLIDSKMEKDKKWECMKGLCDSLIPSTIIRSISLMKNQSAKTQCSSFISKMVDPLTEIINSHPPKITLAHFESFFTDALTVDLPSEIRDSVCTLWKFWYGSRMDELAGASISEELMRRLKWFNLPIPPNTINDKFDVKLEQTSPKKPTLLPSTSKRGAPFSSPAPIKKPKSANDALKMIDLMDEDSVQFYPVEESPKKKQRMTEKQKEMMIEKKDRLPFMEDESTTGIPKIPSDMFEMSITGIDGSKSVGSKQGQMKTDFSDMAIGKKSDDVAKDSQKREEKKKTEKIGEEKEEKEEKTLKKKNIVDANIDESASSAESMNEETEEEEKRGGRRKSKTPMKMIVKAKEGRSPSRKKLDAVMAVDSPKRKVGRPRKSEKKGEEKKKEKKKVEEEEKVDEKNEEETVKKGENAKEKKEEEDKVEEEKQEKEGSVEKSESETASAEKEKETPKRSEKITLSTEKKGEEVVEEVDDSPVLNETPVSSQSVNEDSPMKSVDGDGEVPIPSTPANRGTFEPVGILSSSKKNKSEKKKGGVHFNISDEVKIVEVDEEEVEKKEDEINEKKDEEEGKEDDNDKMIFPLLQDNEDSIDTISLKLGSSSRLTKASLEKIGVKTVGQLASLSAKQINGVIGIRPPKIRTVEAVLDGVLARSQKSASKPLPPICTPEKMKEDTVVSPNKSGPLPPLVMSPISRKTSPPKSKSRKRLTLSDSPVRVKRSKEGEEEEEKKEMEVMDEEKKTNEVMEEKEKEGSMEIEVIANKSDAVEKKSEESDGRGVMIVDDEKENKENGEKKEVQKENPPIATVQDVLSFIDRLKGSVSFPALFDANEQITKALLDAMRDARKSLPDN